VLLGEDAGWRHYSSLRATGSDHGCGECRDHGLAGADISLEQTIHREARVQVAADLGQCALLRGCQCERQCLEPHSSQSSAT
jgi:hypothetical protein